MLPMRLYSCPQWLAGAVTPKQAPNIVVRSCRGPAPLGVRARFKFKATNYEMPLQPLMPRRVDLWHRTNTPILHLSVATRGLWQSRNLPSFIMTATFVAFSTIVHLNTGAEQCIGATVLSRASWPSPWVAWSAQPCELAREVEQRLLAFGICLWIYRGSRIV